MTIEQIKLTRPKNIGLAGLPVLSPPIHIAEPNAHPMIRNVLMC
jgi:hypothetical protein